MTIKEFAEKLGLSTATVSRAFTPGARIHSDTRARILAMAQELGYMPNPSARSLAQRRSYLIGLDYPGNASVLDDLFLMELARGVQEAVRCSEYGLLLNTLPRPDGDLALLREWVFGRAVDGVILVVPPDFPLEALQTLAGREVPCVLIAPGPMSTPLLPTVSLDLEEGARAALRHLRRLGHEHIGFLTSDRNDAVHRVYTEIMAGEGLLKPDLILDSPTSIAGGRAAMHRLLAAPIRPSAVFARTDLIALGALRAARDMGMRIPEDVSLVGHDDIVLAELCDPPLTTVRVNTMQVGRVATELLLTSLASAENDHDAVTTSETPPVVSVSTELIVRASTGPITQSVTSVRPGPRLGSIPAGS